MDRKTIIITGAVILALAGVFVYDVIYGPKPGRTGGAPPKVKYLFEEPNWSPPAFDPGLWASNYRPKDPAFKPGISRQAMSAATGYTGFCELPKVERSQTNTSFCMTCHDGSSGHLIGQGKESHPVSVPVPFGAPGYQATLPSDLVLVDARMECTTCHNYWFVPQQPKWVATTPDRLCTGCHDK